MKLDILTGTTATDFNAELIRWIRDCDMAIIVGSPSYAKRAKDSSTITSREVQELAAKKASNPEGKRLILLLLSC